MSLTSEKKMTALYCRLSQEDEKAGDSMSIQNQKLFLKEYADRNAMCNTRYFIDDGYSGVDFEKREGFKDMLREIEAGHVSTVITKDLSRLGRNYLRTGELIEIIFPENSVRYIAVNDNVDTFREDNEFTPLKNWFNEFYARDTSKKVKAVVKAKAQRGERVGGQFPYGYILNPENKNHLIPDTETAHIVQKIFDLYVHGSRICQIQDWLSENKVLTPSEMLYHRNGKIRWKRPHEDYVYMWADTTVYSILSRREYIGHTITNKSARVSYKSKKRIQHDLDEQYVFQNTHEPLVDEETFEKAQKRLAKKQRPSWDNTLDMFSDKLYCADCGMKLHVCRGEKLPISKHHYTCRSYRKKREARHDLNCTSHYIRKVVLEELVLADLKRVIGYVKNKEDEFIRSAAAYSALEARKSNSEKEKKLNDILNRLNEIDKIFCRIYEDMALGRVSEERYSTLTSGYESEKNSLTAIAEDLKRELEALTSQTKNIKGFVNIVNKYTDITELSYEIIHEFIDKILVHETDRETNTRYIEIHYNFGV